MGITEAIFYRWKKKFAGMGVAELRRLRQLEEEKPKTGYLGNKPKIIYASVAELADAQGLSPCVRKGLWVRLPPLAITLKNKDLC